MKLIDKNSLLIILVAFVGINNYSCKSNSSNPDKIDAANYFGTMQNVDLTDKGILLTIQAPEGAVVDYYDQALEKAVTIEKGKYSVIVDQYSEYADDSGDVKVVKTHRLTKSKERKDFSDLIFEDDESYVFETNDEDLGTDYHFFYVHFANDKEYNFSDGFSIENYTKEEALGMLKSVRQ